ncbi:hypothetical protein C8J57DRAFT_1236018 [Mycena rebaudengoi]|nr:hypothetical protein C8J57DRAFT_1236018 [Mycena rebaudengoi]
MDPIEETIALRPLSDIVGTNIPAFISSLCLQSLRQAIRVPPLPVRLPALAAIIPANFRQSLQIEALAYSRASRAPAARWDQVSDPAPHPRREVTHRLVEEQRLASAVPRTSTLPLRCSCSPPRPCAQPVDDDADSEPASGIRKLMLFGHYLTILPALEKMQLRQLTVELQVLLRGDSAIDPARPLFRALTYLHLLGRPKGLNFEELPALTHLCLSDSASLGLVSSTLANCSRLRVLVTMFRSPLLGIYDQIQLQIDDPCLVLMSLSFEECMEDWKLGVKGGRDFWFHAEKFVASRRRGEIEPGMSCRTRRNTPLTVLASLLAWRCWIEDSDFIN